MRRMWFFVLAVLVCGVFLNGTPAVYGQEGPEDMPGLEGEGGEETPGGEESGGEEEEASLPDEGEEGEGEEAEGEEAEGEDAEEAMAEAEGGVSVFRLILEHSGIPGYIIILMSVVAMYLIVRMAFEYRESELMPEDLVLRLEQDIDNMDLRDAAERCARDECVLATVMEAALREVRAGYEGMKEALEEEGEAESIRMHQHVGWLSIIGAIAPMLGLTGTVLGMMAAFGTISQMDQQPPPAVLAENIQLALTTTCEGLIVAVPVLVFYAVFRNKVTALMLDVGAAGDDLLSYLKNTEITPAMVEEVKEGLRAGEEAEEVVPEDEMPPEGPPAEPEGGIEQEDEDGEAPPPPPPPE